MQESEKHRHQFCLNLRSNKKNKKKILLIIFVYTFQQARIHFFLIRILFIRIPRLIFGTNFFRKWGYIRPLQNKSISNETASQEKQFKHIFRGRGK